MTPPVSYESCFATTEGPQGLSDELLVSAAKAGDRSAFVALCDRHSNKILPGIYRITRNSQDAEDVFQDALLKAFIHFKSFEGRSSFSSWLHKIAINSALMILRKKRFLEIPIDITNDEHSTWGKWEPQDQAKSPEDRYAAREREELLRTAILRLPSIYRDVVQLLHARECSTEELAQTLGISVSTTKTRLSRARIRLRASLLGRNFARRARSASVSTTSLPGGAHQRRSSTGL